MLKDTFHTLIIGTGCAGYNAADWLYDLGVQDIAIVTEGVNMGTSRNTGSDKQTYYKLAIGGPGADSVYEMAKTLFSGGSVHGDTAFIEAASSVTAFTKLVHLGVPFPSNRYGAFVGYQTDHDEAKRQRATSCGPLTSKHMTEALQRSVKKKGITVLDNSRVVKLLVENNEIRGLMILGEKGYTKLYCKNVILATGGPAGIYHDVVFPASQTGGTGLALAAGAAACNLQEWQYGLASVDFRWNVSGTYQQVLPRYISVDADGNEYEFLTDHYDTPNRALDMVFLKGYQWPFDAQKIAGSSKIDQLVATEMNEKGRAVYMDFRRNPTGLDYSQLAPETFEYLQKSGALFGTPIERLAKMNTKAINLYKDNGIDLYTEPLRIAVCAQHCNGGIAVDANWESTVKGLYVVGEAAGSFGVYRPGGSALNATQVSSMRAARHIAKKSGPVAAAVKTKHQNWLLPVEDAQISDGQNCDQTYFRSIQIRMSHYAAYVRNTAEMEKLYAELCEFRDKYRDEHFGSLSAYKIYDLLLTQIAVLSAMIFSAKEIGSRGGAVVDGKPLTANVKTFDDRVIITTHESSKFEPVRPMPEPDDWFENVWNERE